MSSRAVPVAHVARGRGIVCGLRVPASAGIT
jgi:hypothetical protein